MSRHMVYQACSFQQRRAGHSTAAPPGAAPSPVHGTQPAATPCGHWSTRLLASRSSLALGRSFSPASATPVMTCGGGTLGCKLSVARMRLTCLLSGQGKPTDRLGYGICSSRLSVDHTAASSRPFSPHTPAENALRLSQGSCQTTEADQSG